MYENKEELISFIYIFCKVFLIFRKPVVNYSF